VIRLIYDTIISILTIVTMGMIVAMYSDDSRENAIESVLSAQTASSYPTEFAIEIRQQKQLRILLVVNVVLLAFRILAYAPLLRNVSIIVKTLTHALKGVNVVIFIFLFLFVTFTISAHGIFGSTIYRYSTLSHSFISITSALSGHVDLSGRCSRISLVKHRQQHTQQQTQVRRNTIQISLHSFLSCSTLFSCCAYWTFF